MSLTLKLLLVASASLAIIWGYVFSWFIFNHLLIAGKEKGFWVNHPALRQTAFITVGALASGVVFTVSFLFIWPASF